MTYFKNHGPHCGFRFSNGLKCKAAEAHPVHKNKWGGIEVGHYFIPEPHIYSRPFCVECGQPAAEKDYEAAVEALERLVGLSDGWDAAIEGSEWLSRIMEARAVLRRLRDEVPA